MSNKIKQQSIGRDAAIALAETHWWHGKTSREITKFQLFTTEICMPFKEFHKALEESLGRPVFGHELALNFDQIVLEFLGEADAPTMQEIINLIPEDKRIVIVAPPQENREGEEWKDK